MSNEKYKLIYMTKYNKLIEDILQYTKLQMQDCLRGMKDTNVLDILRNNKQQIYYTGHGDHKILLSKFLEFSRFSRVLFLILQSTFIISKYHI